MWVLQAMWEGFMEGVRSPSNKHFFYALFLFIAAELLTHRLLGTEGPTSAFTLVASWMYAEIRAKQDRP